MAVIRMGSSDFKTFIDDGRLYVDKTLFIKELITEGSDITLITRPRRFGKTMNMSMLKHFFDIKADKSLFNGLNISKEKELCAQHQNQYPVIYITFKDCKGKDWTDCFKKIKKMISKMYKEHAYLKDKLENEEELYNLISKNKAEDSDYDSALSDLITYIYKSLDKKVIVLIDEYDAPIQYAYSKDKDEYFNEAVEFFRQFLSPALKDNNYVYKALMTGILRISKENMFSGLNNLEVITILNDEYADKFGFTEDEVNWLISESGSRLPVQEIKEWYNGYNIGKYQIYNPWSTCNAIKLNITDPYWANTSEDKLLWEILEATPSEFTKLLKELIEKKGVAEAKVITKNTTLQDVTTDETHLWTLLLFSGYLTKEKMFDSKTFNLRIPNREVSGIFYEFVKRLTKTYINDVSEIQRALYENNYDKFEKALNRKMEEILSNYDIGIDKEYSYHMLMLGILLTLSKYELASNREMKYGRCDIWMKNKITEQQYIFEFKKSDRKEDLEKDRARAMEQIDTMYSMANETKIGIAFYKKSAKIMVKEGDELLFLSPNTTNEKVNIKKNK